MGGYRRYAMIFDSEAGELGRVAIELIELGIDALYVNDVDEATLLAEQEADRLAAVVIPASCTLPEVDALLARVCTRACGARSLMVVGLEPEPAKLAAYRERQITWALWEPFENRDLRYALTAAMSADGTDARKALRVPSNIETAVFSGRHRNDAVVHDLSVSGAYLASPTPFLEGTLLSLDIALPNGPLVAKAEVVYSKTAEQPGRRDVPDGMGVVFSRFLGDSEATLVDFIQAWVERFRP